MDTGLHPKLHPKSHCEKPPLPSFGKATGQSVFPIAPAEIAYNQLKSAQWGFVKITQMGLYRIDLTTNQFNGVSPDVFLEIPYDYDPFREEDYATALQLDSIFNTTFSCGNY